MIDLPPITPDQNPIEVLHLYVESAVKQSGSANSEADNIQARVVKQEAQRFGTEIGFYYYYTQIQEYLEVNEIALDGIFSFERLTVDGKITYPVVIESERIYEQIDGDKTRRVRTMYRIHSQPKMVSAPPTWREYLVRAPIQPDLPNPAVIPSKDQELLRIWRETVANSFGEGVISARRTYEMDLARLRRDIIGRMNFDVLARKNIVSRPQLHVNELGVVSDSTTLSIGDSIETVIYQSGFNDPDTWMIRGVEPEAESVIDQDEERQMERRK